MGSFVASKSRNLHRFRFLGTISIVKSFVDKQRDENYRLAKEKWSTKEALRMSLSKREYCQACVQEHTANFFVLAFDCNMKK